MVKNFWEKKELLDEIVVESMVKASNFEPAVVIKWGKLEGYLTPEEAIAHAASILSAACAARSDSAVTKLFSSLQGLDIPKAAMFRRLLRDFRIKNQEQDLTEIRMVLDPDKEAVPIKEVRNYALYLLEMSMMSEVEAFLFEYLRQEMGIEVDRINQIVGELRDIMYPKDSKEGEQT